MSFNRKQFDAVLCAGGAIPLLLACSGGLEGTTADNLGKTHQTATAPMSPSGEQSEITIAASPSAKCTLHFPNVTDSDHSMTVYAADDGIVHLWAPHVPERYVLDCDQQGTATTHLIDLEDPATFLPVPPPVIPKNRKILPALSDPMSLSQADLINAGYPPRPDPSAPAYDQWLEMVSSPMTLITDPTLIERPDVRHEPYTNETAHNWDGLSLVASVHYDWVLATFTIPTFSTPNGVSNSAVSMWPGLDGDYNTSPIVLQDGIDYDSTGSIGTYSQWYEYAPDPALYPAGMVVSPGDSMTFWAWEGDSTCASGPGKTGYGCYWYKNNTTGVTLGTLRLPIPPGKTFDGKSAEFIMERPTINGGMRPLSQWLVASMQAAAVDWNANWHNFQSDPYHLITLINTSNQTLADAIHYGGDDMCLYGWERAQ